MKLKSSVLTVLLLAALLLPLSWWWWKPAPQTEDSPSRPTQGPSLAPAGLSLPAVSSPAAAARAQIAGTKGSLQASVLAEFDAWTVKFLEASPSERPSLRPEGERLAAVRRERMLELIQDDPQKALQSALPYAVRKALPDSIRVLVEETVGGRGEFTPIHARPLPDGGEDFEDVTFRVRLHGQNYDAHTYGRRLSQQAGTGRALHGIALSDDKGQKLLALSDEPFRVLDSSEVADRAAELKPEAICGVSKQKSSRPIWVDFGGELRMFCRPSHLETVSRTVGEGESLTPSTAALGLSSIAFSPAGSGTNLPPGGTSGSQGIKKLLLIPSVFADDPRPTVTHDQLQQIARNNNEFFVEGSYGLASFLTTITPVVTLTQTRSFYGEFLGNLFPEAVAAARTLGYTDGYDHIYVIFPNVPAIRFGGRSDGLLHVGAGAITHELGHNFGVVHANFWEVSGRAPGPIQPPNQPPFPIDSGSWTGHDDINAPFILGLAYASPSTEYGHPFDTMGGGGGHFNPYFKSRMNWLPAQFTPVIMRSSTNRIYAFDTPSISDGREYALVIPKNHYSHDSFLLHFVQKNYWISYRSGVSDNPWFANGLEVLWDEGAGVVLLDTTPHTIAGRRDGAVVVGRTFSDPEAQIHVTPIAKGGGPSASDTWIDVVTHIGPFPGNNRPTLSVNASEASIAPGGSVTFTATASDADGDALAYYWEVGTGQFGPNQSTVSWTFAEDGHYVVRCEVSDMKGGVARLNTLVTVGTPTNFLMSGRVLDDLGNPLSGIRVHNSSALPPYFNPGGPNSGTVTGHPPPPTNNPTAAFRSGYTDDNGIYMIGNVPPGTYTNNAFLHGYVSAPLFVNPVVLDNGDAIGLDHLATRLQKVSVAREFDCADESTPGSFIFSRVGDIANDLQVHFVMGGSAQHELDFQSVGWVQTNVTFTTNGMVITTNYNVTVDSVIGAVTIPAGSESVSLPIIPIDNSIKDGGKEITISLILRTNDFRITSRLTNVVTTNMTVVVTNTVFVFTTNQVRVPGWELLPYGPANVRHWFQTYPTYVIGTAEATIRIEDDPGEPDATAAVGVFALDADAMETRADTAMLQFGRFAAPTNNPLTILYDISGTAENGIDYPTLSGQITIPAGARSVILPIAALRDERVEGRETIQLTLRDPGDGSYLVGPADGAQVYIIDDDLPLVSIYPIDSSASKTGNSGRVMVSRAGDLSEPLLVNYLASGTATGGVDYAILPGSITIPAGQLTADIDIVPLNNPNAVGPKLATILLSDSPAYNVSPLNQATVVIRDNLPVVSLTVLNPSPGEAGVVGSFVVARTGPTNTSLNVQFAVGGSAVEQFDYIPIGTNVVIPAGASSATITVSAIADAFNEFGLINRDDDIIIQLLATSNYELGGNSSGRLTLSNDDGSALPAVGFLRRNTTVREGETALLAIRISSNPATNRPATIDYRVTSGSAVAGTHYVPIPGPTAGQTGSVTFVHFEPPDPPIESISAPDEEGSIIVLSVSTLRDNMTSGTRNLTLSLFNPAGYETNFIYSTNMGQVFTNTFLTKIPTNAFIGAHSSHTITIVDIDTNAVGITTTVGAAFEEGLVPGQFVVRREGDLSRPLRVDFSVTGTAASGNDFVALGTNSSVVIPAGTNQVVLPVFPLDDPQQEDPESVVVTLLPRPGVSISSGSATVVIADNDGTIQFAFSRYSISEGVGNGLIAVQRTGATNRTVFVDYSITSGTATPGLDYTPGSGSIRFSPGEVLQYISVPILEDTLVESPETFQIVLTGTTGGVPLGGQSDATVVIEDNDTGFDFAAPTFAAAENSTFAQISVRRYGVTTNSASVWVATTNGTASDVNPGADYVGTNFQLNFGPGETNRVLSLRIIDDLVTESNETVQLSLHTPSLGTLLGSTNTAVLTIVEDECSIEFASPSYSVREFLGQVTVNVHRLGGTVNTQTVNYATVIGTAGGADFVAVSGVLTFRGDRYEALPDGSGTVVYVPGDTNLPITITIIDDTIGEINESFTVQLSALTGTVPGSATFGGNTNTVVTILDNEGPGNLDYEFNPIIGGNSGANGPVRALAFQSEGRILLGGDFTTVAGVLLRGVARLQADGFLDPSFDPGAGADGPVHAVAVQPDNRILIAGDFATVDSVSRSRVARLNADGNIDLLFPQSGGADQVVRALAVQTNGQVLIGGDFTSVAGTSRRGLARYNLNGAVDLAFNPTVMGSVRALAVQTDGRILVGGIFTNIAGVSRPFLARLTSAGAIDNSFSAEQSPRGPVHSISLQNDGKIVVGGSFTNVGGVARTYLVRLNVDGTVDSGFDSGSGPNGTVYSVGVHSNGRVTIGGAFTSVNGVSRNRFARLRPNGVLDGAFDIGSGANSNVLAVAVQPDTATVIGGEFTLVDGVVRNRIARVHGEERSNLIRVEFAESAFYTPEESGSGTLTVIRSGNTNAAFSLNYATIAGTATTPADYVSIASGSLSFASNEVVKTIAVTVNGDSLLEGDESLTVHLFNFPAGSDTTGITNALLVIQDNERTIQFATNEFSVSEGFTNATLTAVRRGGQSGVVSVDYVTADGTAVAGQDYVGVTATLVMEDGETNKSILIPLIDNFVQSANKVFSVTLTNPTNAVLGSPVSANVTIVEDDLPGNLDRSFDPAAGANDIVRSLVVQPDGKVVVGGAFTNFAGANRNYIARLDSDGSVDPMFDPGSGPNGIVGSIALLPDGRTVIGGGFNLFDGSFYKYLTQLRTNGTLDSGFSQDVGFNGSVHVVRARPDGRILVGGAFGLPLKRILQLRLDGSLDTSFDPGSGVNGPVHAIAFQPDGRILIGGAFTTVNGVNRSRVARLHANGSLDADFNLIAITNGTVYSIAIQSSGRVVIGGDFWTTAGSGPARIARLESDGSLDNTFNVGVDGVIFALGLNSDQQILLGGSFTSINGTNRNRIARLNADGGLDLGFDPGTGANGTVLTLAVLPDDDLYIGGDFTVVNGLPRNRIARLLGSGSGAPAFTGFSISGGVLTLTVSGPSGRTFALESSPDLLIWTQVTTSIAVNGSCVFNVPFTGNTLFFRVRELAP